MLEPSLWIPESIIKGKNKSNTINMETTWFIFKKHPVTIKLTITITIYIDSLILMHTRTLRSGIAVVITLLDFRFQPWRQFRYATMLTGKSSLE